MGWVKGWIMTVAVVAKRGPSGLQYLVDRGDGPTWLPTEFFASHFPDMKAATRAASRLPSKHRAFAMPEDAGSDLLSN